MQKGKVHSSMGESLSLPMCKIA
ncbi:protein of unknown function [Xenorhabdus poinarii G6]|uniref:Uncharacterized protein n=1 Tax=Xenorhabdus poinarii G6 TaxID=1354304 RepID=A0A068R5Q0_9GAMM|nr:protein of unknown function [Xenorhabdus poinarii G6]